MARRIRYKIGDVVMIPIFDEKYGLGRILNKDEGTVLLEMYSMDLVSGIEEVDYKKIIQNNKNLVDWVFDEAIKKGEWSIIGNIEVRLPIEMPMFWTSAYKLNSDGELGDSVYYLVKGSFSDSLGSEGKEIYIDKSEIKNYIALGIAFPNMAILDYAKFLLKEGVISKLPDMGQS